MTENSRSRRRGLLPAAVLTVIAVAIVASGLATRWSRAAQLRETATEQAARSVAVISPAPVAGSALTLPGRIEAWSRAPIYARVSGYLKGWSHDIGATVKAGEMLAEIATPDLDQELQQAQAELARARSEAALAETTAQRWQALLASDSVPRQEVEERVADFKARQAAADALRANVDRIQTMQRYRRLTAPFDGIVTARNTDVGALIGVGANDGNALFVVSDVRRLRIYVNVPQRQVAAIGVGSPAWVEVPERPGERFEARVQSLAQAIDAGTGTMRVQLSVDNTNGALLPGGFASVGFEAAAGAQALGLPPSALIIGRNGVQVALVDGDDRAQLRDVAIVRDLGRVVALSGGIGEGDRVIDSPPDGITNGDRLRVVAPQGAAK